VNPRAIVIIRDPSVREELSQSLHRRGFTIRSSHQGEGWSALFNSESPRLILVGDDLSDADPALLLERAGHRQSTIARALIHVDEIELPRALPPGGDPLVGVEEIAEWARSKVAPDTSGSTGCEQVFTEGGAIDLLVPGQHPSMLRMLHTIEAVAPTDTTVLIGGESGTGKDLVARLIHQRSQRSDGPWIPVNCGAIPSTLIESELFGHVKGAFTGAIDDKVGLCKSADGGTLFLDEVGELPLELQVKLLRVLQTGTVRPLGGVDQRADFRVVAATNRDLKEEVQAGRFRLDLFYRINVIAVDLPPLRERVADIPILCERIVTRLNESRGLSGATLHRDVIQVLQSHSWPGNIRELENVVERLLLLYPDGNAEEQEVRLQLQDLSVRVSEDTSVKRPADEGLVPGGWPIEMSLKDLQDQHIEQVLRYHGGNKTLAAKTLGVNVKTIYNRVKRRSEMAQ